MRERITKWLQQLEAMRPTNRVVETGYRLLERDARIAGGVLGGGLAYRLFFWSLALSVLLFGGLGFVAPSTVEEAANNASLGTAFATSMSTAAAESQSSRWWLLLTGIFLVIWFAFTLLRALRLVQAGAWQVPSGRTFPKPLNIASVLAVPVVFILISAMTGVLANVLGPFSGIISFIISTAVFAGLIALGMSWLPHSPAPLRAHLPGAVGLALFLELLGGFGEFYLADELASQQALYGVLGLAATMLFFLYLIGRVTVWSCELNAVSWEVWGDDRA